jgi:hypothetical protein
MSIIAPSFKRIEENFILENKEFLYQKHEEVHASTFIIEPKPEFKQMSLYDTGNDSTV